MYTCALSPAFKSEFNKKKYKLKKFDNKIK